MDKSSKKSRKIQALMSRVEQLEISELALKAQLASRLGAAFENIKKCEQDFFGSAVIVSIKKLNGDDIVAPFALRDGLTPQLIAAFKFDICRSFEKATIVPGAMATYAKEHYYK